MCLCCLSLEPMICMAREKNKMKKNNVFFLVSLRVVMLAFFFVLPCSAYNNIESSSKPQADKTIKMLEEKEDDIKEEVENLKEALKSQIEWTNERLRTVTKIFLLEKNSLLIKKKTLESLKRLKELIKDKKERNKNEKN